MVPQLATGKDAYSVLLLGEALGADEAEAGRPFVGRAGFRLTRLIEWAGLDRSRFSIANAVWCRPPNNLLEGQPYESQSISHCRATQWGRLLARHVVVVPMGNVPTSALLGRKGILRLRGFVFPGREGGGDGATRAALEGYHVLPTVHPSFIARGQAKYSAAFISDLQRAVTVAREGVPTPPAEFLLDPSPRDAYEWALRVVQDVREVSRDRERFGKGDSAHLKGPGGGSDLRYLSRLASSHPPRISFDIETPYKGDDESELELSEADAGSPTSHERPERIQPILRIGFSVGPRSALSIPWSGEYLPAIRVLLESAADKLAHNASFDLGHLRANGVRVKGVVHDSMVAWHILHSDMPKGLSFVASMTLPWQTEWKSLSGSRPAYYNAVDACVTWEAYHVIEAELQREGMWEVYERDVLRLDPILVHMHEKGMPIDAEVRADRVVKLAALQAQALKEMESAVPPEAKRHSPPAGYVRAPEGAGVGPDWTQLTVTEQVKVCERCGAKWTASHGRTLKRPTEKRPQNPCAGAVGQVEPREVQRWARLDPFRPSRDQLMRYQRLLQRPIPTTFDKKTRESQPSMDEKGIKMLMRKFPDDKLYPSVLRFREYSKLAGTYLGVPAGDKESDI